MRRFNQCALCLDEAHLPVACAQGHLTCRECALTSALEQTAAIERTRDELARLERQQEEERERAREDARKKVLCDFERQTALGGRSQAGSSLGECAQLCCVAARWTRWHSIEAEAIMAQPMRMCAVSW
jgi:nitric oxide synthase-interacting protein